MKIVDSTGSYNEIQLFRLRCLQRALASVDPLVDFRAMDLVNHLQNNAIRELGLIPSGIPAREDYNKIVDSFFKVRKTRSYLEDSIKRSLKKEINDPAAFNKALETLRAVVKVAVAEDAKDQRTIRTDITAEIKSMFRPEIVLERPGSAKRTEQIQLIETARKYLLNNSKWYELNSAQRKSASLGLLNLIQTAYEAATKNIGAAIKEKETAQKKLTERNPVLQNLDLLTDTLGLSLVERGLLAFYADTNFSNIEEIKFILNIGAQSGDNFFAHLGIILGHSEDDVRKALDPKSQIRYANLLVQDIAEETADNNGDDGKKNREEYSKDRPSALKLATMDRASRKFYVPLNTLQTLRLENSTIDTLLKALRGEVNPGNNFSLTEHFHEAQIGAKRIAANMVEDLLKIGEPGRKGRYLAGPAGSGKNSLADVLGREIARILNEHNGMNVTVRVEMVAMATGKDAYGRMKAQQLSGKDRVYAHKTADALAANQNARTLKKKEGEIIILLIDEADRDMFNPKLIGSKAESGIKDLFNHHLTNLVTPCVFLLNAAHPDIEHVWRRVATGLWLGVHGLEGRIRTVTQYCKESGFDIPKENISNIAERYAHTPGILEAVIKDIKVQVDLIQKDERRTVPASEILRYMELSFAEHERVNNEGKRPIPNLIKLRPAFDFDLAHSPLKTFAHDVATIINRDHFTGNAHSYLISGPDGAGKRTLVHHIAAELAKKKGHDHPRVIEIGYPLDGPTTDRAIADDAVVMVYNFPYEDLEYMDETTYPLKYALDLPNPVFYVAPASGRLFHPHMTECFHLGYLTKKKILLAYHKLMPEYSIDLRVQYVERVTLGNIETLTKWAKNREALNGRRPSSEEVLFRFMEQNGLNPETYMSLGRGKSERFTLEDALREVNAVQEKSLEAKKSPTVILSHPRFQAK